MYFLAKTSFFSEADNGTLVKQKRDIIVEDEAYVGVEAVIQQYFEERGHSEHRISSIKKLKVDSLLEDENDIGFFHENWYKAVVSFTSENEKTGKEKVVFCHFFINAKDFQSAYEIIKKDIKKSLIPSEICSVSLSSVKDFIPTDVKPVKAVEEEEEEEESVRDINKGWVSDSGYGTTGGYGSVGEVGVQSDTQKPHEK